MQYETVVAGRFLERPNRFIAHVEIDGELQICHVKNTGRCKELLLPGISTVYLEDHGTTTKRKTRYSLIAVEKESNKGTMLINMDSQAPNKVVKEWLEAGGLGKEITFLKMEQTYGDSRYDVYFEYVSDDQQTVKAYMEVKGVTLEDNGQVRFPDAPTSRGAKHMEGLIRAKAAGYEAYIMFVVQLEHYTSFEANAVTDPAFASTLQRAKEAGVIVMDRGCKVTPNSLVLL